MKEIIKRGTKEIAICKTCGCVFSYEIEDLINKDIDNYKGWKEYVVCPQCSCEVVARKTR